MIESKYEIALVDIVKGLFDRDILLVKNAAYSLETAVELGLVPKNLEFLTTLYSAISYDISNEPFDAKRLYKQLFDLQSLDLTNILSSAFHSKAASDALAHVGLRELKEFEKRLDNIVTYLKNKEKIQGYVVQDEFKDDYAVLLSLMNLIRSFYSAINKLDIRKHKDVLLTANKFYHDLKKFDSESWIEILALLYLELIRSLSERSILGLDISEKIKKAMLNNAVSELWIPQIKAIQAGVLEGNNILYSSPTGTGKSFLAYVSIGKLKDNKQAVYMVPTKSLSSQVYDDLATILGKDYNLAISDRDRNDDDEVLDEKDVLVTTYEKMDALLRRNKIQQERLQTIIVDEMHYLGDPQRGLTLEFLLTKFSKKDDMKEPQLITLSALLSEEDSIDLAKWLNAELVTSRWKGVKIDEIIYYGGKLHYRDGDSLPAPIVPDGKWQKYEQRKFICSYYAKRALIQNEPLLISMTKREFVPRLADEIQDLVRVVNLLEMDLLQVLQSKKKIHDEVIDLIRLIEPELPPFAVELISMLQVGVAYHHAGLPIKYRTIIENALRRNAIEVVVATTTLEAGVNLPIKTVIFFEPRYNFGNKWSAMNNRTYRNVSGRAGRPGFHKKGEVIVLALSENEFTMYKDKFWGSDIESIRSPFNEIIAGKKAAKSSLQSQLLGLVVANKEIDIEFLKNHLASTWFWKRTKEKKSKEMVTKIIDNEIRILNDAGFLIIEENVIKPTDIGEKVNESMFSPLSALTLMKCVEYMFSANLDDPDLTYFILTLAGIPIEISNNDRLVENVIITKPINDLGNVFQNITNLTLDRERLETALRYGTALYYWINSMHTSELLELCNLDLSSDTAFLEEGLAKDVYWVLSTIAAIAESMENSNSIKVEKIKQIAEFCRYGTSDPLALYLLSSGLKHIGRTTALKLTNFLQVQGVDLLSLTGEQFTNMFPSNKRTAKLLYQEIQDRQDSLFQSI